MRCSNHFITRVRFGEGLHVRQVAGLSAGTIIHTIIYNRIQSG